MSYPVYSLFCGPPELDAEALLRRRQVLPEASIEELLPRRLICQERLKKLRVAVVGGGLAGLMAARSLGHQGVHVTLFEARRRMGGRVLSNRTFAEGRVIEEGAELIGSFHTTWLRLAREYGIGLVSRMDDDLYERARLDVKLTLDKPLSASEIRAVGEELKRDVLVPLAQLAARSVTHPAEPWRDAATLRPLDITVAEALKKRFRIDPAVRPRLWKAIEFLLVNNEVAPLEQMSLIGLLCKIRAAQDVKFSNDDPTGQDALMRYWTELEIFRCADGCDLLASKIREECETKLRMKLHRSTAVTEIDLSPSGAKVTFRSVDTKGTVAKAFSTLDFDFVVLATPPSVWGVPKITDRGKDAAPEREIGLLGMGPALKHFSKLRGRFWIQEGAAPYGGASGVGQVWEGTDNQTSISGQATVLSVFAGPVGGTPSSARPPTRAEIETGLRALYKGYEANRAGAPNDRLFSDWPNVPFIKTGYASPRVGQILGFARRLTVAFHDRLFFAGEHTQTDFFGYMEGALRSGERAARRLMQRACGEEEEEDPKTIVAEAGFRTGADVFTGANVLTEGEFPVGTYLRAETPPEKKPPATVEKCGFFGPAGDIPTEAALRSAVVSAADAERTRWFDSTSKTLQKETAAARFGDLVRYALAGTNSNIFPQRLLDVQAGAIDPKVNYARLSNATLRRAVADFAAAEAKVISKTNDVYAKSRTFDTRQRELILAETALRAAQAKVKAANDRVTAATTMTGAAGDAQRKAAADELAKAKRAERDARKARDEAKTRRDEAKTAVDKALKDQKAAVAARKPFEKPASTLKATAKRDVRIELVSAPTTDTQNIDSDVEQAITTAHTSSADIFAWSAIFVSACVRTAAIQLKLEAKVSGAHEGKNAILLMTQRHADYVIAARDAATTSGGYRAFTPTSRKVQRADIIVTDRTDFIQQPITLSALATGRALHGDIVVDIIFKDGKPAFAQTIGGNVRHTVRRRRYPLDPATGKLKIDNGTLFFQEDDSGNFPSPPTPLSPAPSLLQVMSCGRIMALLSLVHTCKRVPVTPPPTNQGSTNQGSSARELENEFESPFLSETFVTDADQNVSHSFELLESPFLDTPLGPKRGS
ncbi:MAG: DUF2272 domain-containing protein [Myxococcota bacterium]